MPWLRRLLGLEKPEEPPMPPAASGDAAPRPDALVGRPETETAAPEDAPSSPEPDPPDDAPPPDGPEEGPIREMLETEATYEYGEAFLSDCRGVAGVTVRIGGGKAVSALAEALRKFGQQGRSTQTCAAADALGALGDPAAAEPLVKAHHYAHIVHLDADATDAILGALGKLDCPEANAFLEKQGVAAARASKAIDALGNDVDGLVDALLTHLGDPDVERAIGERLSLVGGHAAMAHANQVVRQRRGAGAARLLESTWNGVGGWMG